MIKNTLKLPRNVLEDVMNGEEDATDSRGKDQIMTNQLNVTWNINILFPSLMKAKGGSLIKM